MSASMLILYCPTPASDISLSVLSFVLHLLNHIFRYFVTYIYIYQIFWLLVSSSHCTYPTMLPRSYSNCPCPIISASTLPITLFLSNNFSQHAALRIAHTQEFLRGHCHSYCPYPITSASTLPFALLLPNNFSQYVELRIARAQIIGQYTALRICFIQQFWPAHCSSYCPYRTI